MSARKKHTDSVDKGAIEFKAIGHIQNEFDEPTSSDILRERESQILIKPEFRQGLQGLEPGQQVLVLFYFHLSQIGPLLQHPRGDENRAKRGVFALRSPHRPNPIGLSQVTIIEIKDDLLLVRGLDALNQSPVLDIKPA